MEIIIYYESIFHNESNNKVNNLVTSLNKIKDADSQR